MRLASFAPGVPLTGVNLLTGITLDRSCGGQNVADTVTFLPPVSGRYRIAVARDWNSSAGASGAYSLSISSTQPESSLGLTADNLASGATGRQCGYRFEATSNWACAAGISCQDVFDFETVGPTAVTIAIDNVNCASVPRLALFNGSALNTLNRLNGNLADRRCVWQNQSDSATSASLPSGLHRLAAGRDWNNSAGASGNYRVRLTTTNLPLAIIGQTGDNIATGLAATTCP